MPEERNRSSGSGGGYNRNRRNYDDDFRFEIVDRFGVIATSVSGWSKELNRVSWNGSDPKYDIREWSPDHARMRRGVTFTDEEALELKELLDRAFGGGGAGLLPEELEPAGFQQLPEDTQVLSA